MNEVDRIRKLLADTKAGEKGWRKALTATEGSFSRTLAQKNLSRLAALRETLLTQLSAADSMRQSAGQAAIQNGMIVDDPAGNVAEPKLA